MIQLNDLRLYQACPILYQNRDRIDSSIQRGYLPDSILGKYHEMVAKVSLVCCRRMFTAEVKYDRKKMEKLWKTAFLEVFCPQEKLISGEFTLKYNASLPILHDLIKWLDTLPGRIVGINLPLTVSLYGRPLEVTIPLVLVEDNGMSLVFFEKCYWMQPFVFDPVVRFSALAVYENTPNRSESASIVKITNITPVTLGAHRIGVMNFYPDNNYWDSALRDFASLLSAIEGKIIYPNLAVCYGCSFKDRCEYFQIDDSLDTFGSK